MERESLHMDESTDIIIKVYSTLVYRLAFTRTGTKEDADDIFQEEFILCLPF